MVLRLKLKMVPREQTFLNSGPEDARSPRLRALAFACCVATCLLALATGSSVWAVVYAEPQQALGAQFPGARIERTPLYLKERERDQLERQLGFRLQSRFHTFYVAQRAGRTVGYATFDTHRVRTKEETLLVIINPEGTVRHVEVISFFEPQEYLAPTRWLRLFEGRRNGIQPGVDMPAISGATMTTNAVARTVRKVLLLSQLHFGR